jgi:hypothetical protein
MQTFEDIKNLWNESGKGNFSPTPYDQKSLEQIVKSRTKKHMKASMQYFWGALFLQILVYALLSHVIIKYGSDPQTLITGAAGILLFLPFTVVLMKKFKQIAITRPEGNTGGPLYDYVVRQQKLLQSFYSFKKRYELLLVPLSSAIGVFLTFKLFVPGGVMEHQMGAVITLLITLISMVYAIRSENRKSFEQPLGNLDALLRQFKHDK